MGALPFLFFKHANYSAMLNSFPQTLAVTIARISTQLKVLTLQFYVLLAAQTLALVIYRKQLKLLCHGEY